MTLDLDRQHESRIQQLQDFYTRMLGKKVNRGGGGQVPTARIRCRETGEIFIGYTAAAKAKGASPAGIYGACQRGSKSGGFHWELLKKKS